MLELRKVQTTSQTINVTIRHTEFEAVNNQTDFFLDNAYNPEMNSLQVFLNGVLQRNLDDYIEVDSNVIRFLTPLLSGDKITCREIT